MPHSTSQLDYPDSRFAMNDRVNKAVRDLTTDESLLAAFKDQPTLALKSYDLLECELEAIKQGDQQALLNHGLDPMIMEGRVSAAHWFTGLFATVSRRLAAPTVIAILLALGIHAADTQSASAARTNIRARRRVRSARAHNPLGIRTFSVRANARARTRSNVRAAQTDVRKRASARAGLNNALSQVGCIKCVATDK